MTAGEQAGWRASAARAGVEVGVGASPEAGAERERAGVMEPAVKVMLEAGAMWAENSLQTHATSY